MATKAPKKPAKNAPLSKWEDYDKKKSAYDSDMSKKQKIQKKHSK